MRFMNSLIGQTVVSDCNGCGSIYKIDCVLKGSCPHSKPHIYVGTGCNDAKCKPVNSNVDWDRMKAFFKEEVEEIKKEDNGLVLDELDVL